MELLESYNLYLVIVGFAVLGIATLLHRFADRAFSFPIVALGFGWVVFTLPGSPTPPDPARDSIWILHLTELGVIISLMGVGLKIDRLPNFWSWSSTWLLLGVAMPLTIVMTAFLGWGLLGLAPASALLLGAVLAPTDPVLASDVQVGEPEVCPGDQHPAEKEDELRFTLTSEAGMNDALAFPFVYLALAWPAAGILHSADWLSAWLVWDVVYRLVAGAACGLVLGGLLAMVLLRLPVTEEHERMRTGVGALAGTLVLYGVTELLAGYGFLAVFIGALVIRHYEETHQSHRSLHVFAEQSEQLLMTAVLIGLGAAIAGGLFDALTWQAILLSVLLVVVIRPICGFVSLFFNPRLNTTDTLLVSFFGIRGIGTLFYLAYALKEMHFPEAELLWATCGFTILLSVCLHGVTASPLLHWRNRQSTD